MLPLILNQRLSEVIRDQYRLNNRRFRKAVSRRGRFNEDLRSIIKRHLALSDVVQTFNSFLMVILAAALCGHTAIIIIIVYAIMFLGFCDPTSATGAVLLLIGNAISLLVHTFSAVAVHNEVSSNIFVIKSFF